MLVTKHAAELLALLVSDLHGELPSRIVVALLAHGRLTVTQIAQHTTLGPRHVRSGLAVLIQQNLIYHFTDPATRVTTYEANSDACFNTVRAGKILEVIESQYGTAERDLVQTLLLLGHARVIDLIQAFESRSPRVNGHPNGTGSHESSTELIRNKHQLSASLTRLIQSEILETVRLESLRNPADVFGEIKSDVMRTHPGERVTKKKDEQHQQMVEGFRKYREQSRVLKHQLDQFGGSRPPKRRRLENVDGMNGHAFGSDDDNAPPLNPNIIVRVNHSKCLVELRNERLANYAADSLGEVTGQVYRAVLELVTAHIPRCRADPFIEGESAPTASSVTTMEVFDHLDPSVMVSGGMGKAPKEKLDSQSAEKIRLHSYDTESSSDDSDFEPPVRRGGIRTIDIDDDFDDEEDDVDAHHQAGPSQTKVNGNRQTKVKFEEGVSDKERRLDQMRQHLLMLSESKTRFIRHCGQQGRGQWTVDLEQVMARLQDSELDAYIEQTYGRHGLRLTRILREKGKLDEKLLHSAALMKKSDVQSKMLAMQMAGLVDVQEVPKDSSRMANRTLFFWFFDADRTRAQLLDDVYKAMLRCMETLQVERHRERNILSFVERVDVQGKEEEVMTAEHYNKYNQHLEVQDKLLGQVMRLDDLVAVFRDY